MAKKTRILVVEDNDFVRMQTTKFLQSDEAAAYEIVEARDGLEAQELIHGGISLAIVDIRMEPIDGFEFIKHIRGENNQTPVILVTGDDNPDLLSEASKWGVGAVLLKPVQRDRLLSTVNRTLQNANRSS